MTIIIAGSRSVSDGHIKNQNGRWTWYPELSPMIQEHNLGVLHETILRSGFHTTVANLHHYKGPGVRICRGTPWGNPYTHLAGPTLAEQKVSSREEAISLYKDWFMERHDLQARLPELRGKVLLCYCHPASCHGHFLAECTGQVEKVVEGGAYGADRLGRLWAQQQKLPFDTMNADWNLHGLGAGLKRNTAMGERQDVDGAVILMHNNSRGSMHMANEMRRLGKEVYIQPVRVEDHLAYLDS